MGDQAVISNPVDTAAPATPVDAGTTAGTGEPQSGQVDVSDNTEAQGTPAEDTFSSIDPKTLPPELQGLHKQLQADYTRKTQNAAELRKKAEAYDKMLAEQSSQEESKPLSKADAARKEQLEEEIGFEISDDEFNKAFESKEGFLKFLQKSVVAFNADSQKKISQLEKTQQVNRAKEIIDEFAEETDPTTGQKIRGDFDEMDSHGFITYQLRLNPPKTEAEFQTRVAEAYTNAKRVYTDIYEKGRKDAMEAIKKKAASSMEMPTQSPQNAYTGGDPRKLSVGDAFALARKGIRVPKN
jgi:hypothetical protein